MFLPYVLRHSKSTLNMCNIAAENMLPKSGFYIDQGKKNAVSRRKVSQHISGLCLPFTLGLGSSAKQEQTEMCMQVGIRMERR